MNIVYVFIGNLPDYSIATVHQARLFFDGPIYFIVSEMSSPYVAVLKEKYDVIIIPYESVRDAEFNNIFDIHSAKFTITPWVHGREKLFIYAFERFFALNNLMKQRGLTDVLFLELDNLIYDNPTKWRTSLKTRGIAYLYDNVNRSSSGCCFIASSEHLEELNRHFIYHILKHTDGLLEEMSALYLYWTKNKDKVLFLPTHWTDPRYSEELWKHTGLFGDSIFDAAAVGIFLGGVELCHSGGVLKTGTKWSLSEIDYTGYRYKWEDEDGKRIPYIGSQDKWYRINNLHVHSKVLGPLLSAPLK